ncbi:MAG: amidohydrolase family protein [Armatimonadota bacterium]|nr:amidohydrolase family protein [bacterium]
MIYKAAYVLPISDAPISHGEVMVVDGEIRGVGRDLSSSFPGEPVNNLEQCALLPGFINAHSHIDYTSSRNRVDALNLWDWLEAVAYNPSRRPDYDEVLLSAIMGAAECARSGITCLGDCTFTGAAVNAMSRVGLRGVAYLELFGQSMANRYVEEYQDKLDKVAHLQQNASPHILVGLSPHTVYTSNADVLKLCAHSCTELHIPIALHLAETAAEAQYTLLGTGPIAEMRRKMNREPMVCGMTPARLLESVGLLTKGVSLAHCVHLASDEIELIAHSGAGIVHCPRSNAFLGAGVAPVTELLIEGARVSLGTDSAGSCMRLDFFEEMRFALGIARAVRQEAAMLMAKDVLRMATIGGAETLGLDESVGTLEVGKRADMVAVDISKMLPGECVELAIISRSPSDVIFTMVDGVEISRNGRATMVDELTCEAELKEHMERSGVG